MRLFIIAMIALALLPFGWTKGRPERLRPADTSIKVEVEGRGDIVIRLFTKEAPKTTSHILRLVKSGFYNGQRFHRVERQPRPYLAWFGDPNSKSGDLDNPNIGKGGTGAKIPYENTGRNHTVGAVGLAHPVNEKDAGDSQFYFVLGAASFLDGNYTVFGQVVSGQDVMQRVQRGDRVVSVSIVND